MLKRYGPIWPTRKAKKRTALIQRYQRQVPGSHIQVDVKFPKFKNGRARKVKRHQVTAIDDVTRIRSISAYKRHDQKKLSIV